MHLISILSAVIKQTKQIKPSCNQNQQCPGNPQAALYLQETFAQPQVCYQQRVQVVIPSGDILCLCSAVTAQGLEPIAIVCAGEMRGKKRVRSLITK